MSSDVVKCPKDWFSVRETCRENKDMVCGGRAKKPARAQREDYAEQSELKSLSSHGGGVFFIRHCQVCPYIPYFLPDLWRYKGGPPFFINDTVMRRVGRSESL